MTNSEARTAAILARRAERLAARDANPRPQCTVPGCARYEHRVARCEAHWLPMRDLVGTMAGEEYGLRTSRRTFSEAMSTTTMSHHEWDALADYRYEPNAPEVKDLLDRAADALFAAGYRITVGSRGGRYLKRVTPAA